MSNERVWTVDDDGDLLRGGYYPRGASGTGMADDEADELRAILERGQAPAAPSEGDGRREVPLMTGHAVWQAISAGQRVEWRHPEGHWTDVLPEEWEKHADSLASVVARIADPAASSPDPLPPGVHRAPVHLLLDIWQAMGGESEDFHPWWAADPSFPDRWSQIVAAVAGNFDALAKDTNPPAGDLLPLARDFHGQLLTPAAPLPPGVHRAPNGALWLLPGAKMPEGYEFRLSRFHAWDTPIPSALAEPVWSDQARELRPLPVPPVPEPEKVPWAEAIWNKRLIARTFEGREPFVAMFVDDATGTEFAATLEKIITDGDGYEPIDADGLVSVLPLGDPK